LSASELRSDNERVVYNRNGHLLVNHQGRVVSIYIDNGVQDFIGHFRQITRIDLDELAQALEGRAEGPPTEPDIFDLAYWLRNADEETEVYDPADENWHEEVEEKTDKYMPNRTSGEH
jgi:hypothetical protein